MQRKNKCRMSRLKAIDDENMKIFQNLTRIKSSLSRQNFNKHVEAAENVKQMLVSHKSKIDPLLSIEKARRESNGHYFPKRQTTTTPFGFNS